jgi:hypothetical protein
MDYLLSLSSFFFACSEVPVSNKIYAEYLKEDTVSLVKAGKNDSLPLYNHQYAVHFTYHNDGSLSKIYVELLNESYGNYFDFDVFGNLDEFKFLLDNGKYFKYQLSFSAGQKKYIETGSQYVDYLESNVASDSSKRRLTFLFLSFPRSNLKVKISTFNHPEGEQFVLKKSLLMPYLYELDTVLSKDIDKIYITTEAEGNPYSIFGIENMKVFRDSLEIK